jgi:hypothetical protein
MLAQEFGPHYPDRFRALAKQATCRGSARHLVEKAAPGKAIDIPHVERPINVGDTDEPGIGMIIAKRPEPAEFGRPDRLRCGTLSSGG